MKYLNYKTLANFNKVLILSLVLLYSNCAGIGTKNVNKDTFKKQINNVVSNDNYRRYLLDKIDKSKIIDSKEFSKKFLENNKEENEIFIDKEIKDRDERFQARFLDSNLEKYISTGIPARDKVLDFDEQIIKKLNKVIVGKITKSSAIKSSPFKSANSDRLIFVETDKKKSYVIKIMSRKSQARGELDLIKNNTIKNLKDIIRKKLSERPNPRKLPNLIDYYFSDSMKINGKIIYVTVMSKAPGIDFDDLRNKLGEIDEKQAYEIGANIGSQLGRLNRFFRNERFVKKPSFLIHPDGTIRNFFLDIKTGVFSWIDLGGIKTIPYKKEGKDEINEDYIDAEDNFMRSIQFTFFPRGIYDFYSGRKDKTNHTLKDSINKEGFKFLKSHRIGALIMKQVIRNYFIESKTSDTYKNQNSYFESYKKLLYNYQKGMEIVYSKEKSKAEKILDYVFNKPSADEIFKKYAINLSSYFTGDKKESIIKLNHDFRSKITYGNYNCLRYRMNKFFYKFYINKLESTVTECIEKNLDKVISLYENFYDDLDIKIYLNYRQKVRVEFINRFSKYCTKEIYDKLITYEDKVNSKAILYKENF